MTSFTITYIQPKEDCPAFTVNYQDFVIKEEAIIIKTLSERTQEVAQCFFAAYREALCSTFSILGTSFRFTVLGIYRDGSIRAPAGIIYIIFKTAIWLLELTWCVVATTSRRFMEKLHEKSPKSSLSTFQSHEININHLKTKELALDVSGVPPTVTVNQLGEMLEAVNFEDATKPGYMRPASRSEGGQPYTKEQLREYLTTFILHVNTRKPYLGTPPAHDLPRLLAFYQQLEDAVRLSIHKVNTDLARFKADHPEDPALYETKVNQEYHELLQARARVALDLAIAGAHCGARYMGEAMSIHSHLYGESGGGGGTLEDEILETLAKKRGEIAEKHIAKHNPRGDTHFYAAYKGQLGPILALPGTKNIVEHLTTVNQQGYIDLFFGAPDKGAPVETYTVNTIIKTLQDKLCKSQAFREKVIDWVKDQLNDWNQAKYAELKLQLLPRIQTILAEPTVADPQTMDNLRAFHHIATQVMGNPPPNLKKDLEEQDWEGFIQEILATDLAQELMRQCSKKRGDLQNACQTLGAEDASALRNAIVNTQVAFSFNELETHLAVHTKVRHIMSVFAVYDADGYLDVDQSMQPPSEETIKRMIQGDSAQLEVLLHDHLERARRDAFFARFTEQHGADAEFDVPEQKRANESNLPPEKRAPEWMVSKELIEWLLVSHNVLMTQAPKVHKKEDTMLLQQPDKQSNYFEVIKYKFSTCSGVDEAAKKHMLTWLESAYGPTSIDSRDLEKRAEYILKAYPQIDHTNNQNRYWFKANCYSTQLIKILFDHAFREETADEIIRAAECTHAKGKFYPNWKKVTHIQLTSFVAAITENPLIKLIFSIASTYHAVRIAHRFYNTVNDFTVRVIIPLYINKAPLSAVKFCNTVYDRASDATNWTRSNFGKLALGYLITFFVISKLRILIPGLSRAITKILVYAHPWNVYQFFFVRVTFTSYAIHLAFQILSFTWETCNKLNHQCTQISRHAAHQKLSLSYEKACAIWNTIMYQALSAHTNSQG